AIGVVSTALIWFVSPWRPQLRFSVASLRDLGGFSIRVFGQRLLYYLHRNVDNLLVGRFLGAAALGVYALAYNLMLVPFSPLRRPPLSARRAGRAGPGGAVPGVLPPAGRTAPHRGDVAPRRPARRRRDRAGAHGARDCRAGLRDRGARRPLERDGARPSDPRLG